MNNNNNNKEEDQLVLVSEDGWVMQDCGNLNIPKNSKGSFCSVSDNIGYSSRSKYVA